MRLFKKARATTASQWLAGLTQNRRVQTMSTGPDFERFMRSYFYPEALLGTELLAQAPLKGDRPEVARIIVQAAQVAKIRRDMDGLQEIAQVGLAAIMRWPES